MTYKQFKKLLTKDKLTLSEKVEIFNYWIKHHSPNVELIDFVHHREMNLSDCVIKEPTTKEGLRLLYYSVSKIREQFKN